MKTYLKYLCAVLLVIGTSASAWAATTTETLSLNKCDWGFSTAGSKVWEWGYYSADGYAIYGQGVRMNYYGGDYLALLLNKNCSAHIILPSISGTVSRIDVTAYSDASVDANISLYANGVLVSEKHIGRGSVYWTGTWTAGTELKLQNDDDNTGNITQLTTIVITHNGSHQGGSAPVGTYQINTMASPSGAGTATASASSAEGEDVITITATPASGYQFKQWDVTYTTACSNPTSLSWEWESSSSYLSSTARFYMPYGKVTAVAVFEESTCTAPTVAFTSAGPIAKDVTSSSFTNAATVKYNSVSTGQTITYTTSNSSVADVNSSTGAITIGGTAGSATITATATENATYCEASASYTINVAAVAPTLDEDATGKELTTSSITSSSVTVAGGIITNKGGANITQYGFVIGTSCGVTYATATKKAGWSGDKALNTAFGSGTISGLSANTTYYVRAFAYNGTEYGYSDCVSFKTLASYVITHDKNDGSGTTTTTNVDAGGSITVGSGTSFSRTGYTLTNWRLNNASTGTVYSTGATYGSISAAATFYAQWTANTYAVHFDANGGTGSMSNQNFTYGVAQDLTANAFTRSGYDFAGWATSENGAVVYADEEEVSNLSSTNGATVDLYAKWTAHEITITLDKNDGDEDGEAKVLYGATGLKDGTLTHATKTGDYTLEGYYAEAGHTTKVLNNDGTFAASTVSGYITGGNWSRDAATTLYAYFTANPQTVTFDLDGKGDNFVRVVDYGGKVTKPADPVNVDYNFVKWVTTDGGNTEFDFANTTITSDVTIYSKWTAKTYENLIFACADISLDTEDGDPILVTSRNGINIMATKKLSLTVSGALDGHRVTISGSGLKFYKNDGTRFIELTGSNSLVAPLTDQVVYVSYNPTTDGSGDFVTPDITVACDGYEDTFSGKVKARNLPAAVAIVAKVGGTWRALPANMATEQTPAPVMVSTAIDGVRKAYGPSTIGYKLWCTSTVGSSNNRWGNFSTPATMYADRLRFAGNSDKGLWANNSTTANGIKNFAAIDEAVDFADNEPAYEWIVTTTEVDGEFVYTLQTDQTQNTNNLRLWGSKWGTYDSSHGQAEVYILPLVPTETADVTVMEWGTNMLAVKYANAGTVASGTFKAQIGTNDKTSVTCERLGDAGSDIYKLTGVGDLQGNPASTLALTMTETSTPKQAVFAIPLIITASKTEAEISSYAAGGNGSTLMTEGRAIAKGLDVIIRKGGTLTTGTASGKFADLYIYPGGKADLSQNIGFSNIYLRGGFSWLDGTSKSYDLPQMKVADEVTIDGVQSTGNGIYYDLHLDKRRYYMMAVPKDVPLANITNEEGGDSFTAWLKQYSGQGRTLNPKQSGWIATITNNTLYRGVGYEMSIKPRVTGRLIGVLRMPLLSETAWSNEGNCAPQVKAWGANDDNVYANNKGWNFIGNPFFTAFQNTDANGQFGTNMEIRDMVHHEENGQWTGTWDWSEEAEAVKYITIPEKMYDDYTDVRAKNYELEAFYPFFIQASNDGYLTFENGSKILKAPSLIRTAVRAREVDIDFMLSNGNGVSDQAGLTVGNDYSADFDMEDKEKSIVSENYLKIYTKVGEYRTAFNSLPEAVAELPIPVGYIAPEAGKYYITLVEGNYAEVEHVWFTDYETTRTVDLLDGTYDFQSAKGQFDNRFAINVILKPEQPETPTGVENIEIDSEQPFKFIYQDQMYILRGGVIYDATGKKVREINK